MNKMEELFIPTWIRILNSNGNNMSLIAKETQITYAHVVKVVKVLEKKKFVRTKRIRRVRLVERTVKGEKLRKALEVLS